VRGSKQKELDLKNSYPNATLMRIDIAAPTKIIEWVPDFRSLTYFLVGVKDVCFDYDLGNGDLLLKCSHQGSVKVAKSIGENDIQLEDGTSISGKPFLSYNGSIYESEIWLTRSGFSLRTTETGYLGFYSRDTVNPILSIVAGVNIKGQFVDGILQRGCNVLPGGRYALLNVWYDNFKGQLLVDGLSGQYRELPADSRVYQNLNTLTYDVKFSLSGTAFNRFKANAELLPRPHSVPHPP